MAKLRRYRFELVGVDDPRPVTWPIPHPYWCTGYSSSDGPIIVAYGESDEYILANWPEAELPLDYEEVDGYKFSDRFPKPDWFEFPEEADRG